MRQSSSANSLELAVDSGRLPKSSSIWYRYFFVRVSYHETEAPVIHSLCKKRSPSWAIRQETLILCAI